MGKKAKWFVAVKKVFSPESKKKKKEARLKKKFEPGASVLVDPCPTETLEGTVCEVVPPPLPHTQKDKAVEAESEQRRHDSSLAVATATEPLMTSACASIEVNRLASATQFAGKMSEEIAAIKIQTAFRGHLARRALRALRGLVRLKSLVDGNSVQRQAITTLRCMQTLGRVQSQIRFQRITILEENQALKRQMLLKHERELESLKMGEEWDDSLQSKEQLEASLLSKQEASIRRERAMAYAFSHQWKSSSKPVNPMFMDPNNVQWGWSWLERWMAGTSDKEPTSDAGGEILKDRPSPVVHKLNHPASRQVPSTPPVKAPWLTKKIKSASPKRGWPPLEDDSKSTATVQSERPRRHSFAAASTREDEGLASSLAVPSYMAPTESARAKSRFQSLSNDNIESSDKSPVASVKKRLSFPAGERYATSSAPSSAMRRSSGPPKVDVASVKDIEIQS